MASPSDGSFTGGLQGGFFLEQNGSATGTITYSITLPNNAACSGSGSAKVTGTLSGQNVSLTASTGTETFTLTGTLDFDAATISGTYASTPGTGTDGSTCGVAESNLQWNATQIPLITGPVAGTFLSGNSSNGLLFQQYFQVSGSLTQGANTGATSASVTGSLSFTDYPCITTASVNGQISGTSVTLQLVGSNGSTIGQIGPVAGSTAGLGPVIVMASGANYILQGQAPSYIIATGSSPPCPGSLASTGSAGDYGNVCLGLSVTSSLCEPPLTLLLPGASSPVQVSEALFPQLSQGCNPLIFPAGRMPEKIGPQLLRFSHLQMAYSGTGLSTNRSQEPPEHYSEFE